MDKKGIPSYDFQVLDCQGGIFYKRSLYLLPRQLHSLFNEMEDARMRITLSAMLNDCDSIFDDNLFEVIQQHFGCDSIGLTITASRVSESFVKCKLI